MWQHLAVDPLVRTVDRALDRLAVGRTGAVLVACSGGPDSAALAHAAMDLAARGRLGPVTLVYVDHQLRPDSAADGQTVVALAAQGGADAVTVTVSVDRRRRSLEEAAREARYQALTGMADQRGAVAILVAHNADDQAETVLMRIVRGTGVAGLAGIPARRGRVVRPLLDLRRDQNRGVLPAPPAGHGDRSHEPRSPPPPQPDPGEVASGAAAGESSA